MKKKNQHKNKDQGSRSKERVTRKVLDTIPLTLNPKVEQVVKEQVTLPKDTIGRRIYEYVMQQD